MPFRRAKTIELHDANVTITLSQEGYGKTALAGRHEQASRPAFQVRLADILALAGRFGARARGERLLENAQEEALPIWRTYSEIPANQRGLEIMGLECDVLGPNLVDIRIETRREGDAPETAGTVETITHSGSFTIWWAAEPMASAEELFAVAEAHPPIPVEGETPTALGGEQADVGVIIPKLADMDTTAQT